MAGGAFSSGPVDLSTLVQLDQRLECTWKHLGISPCTEKLSAQEELRAEPKRSCCIFSVSAVWRMTQ